MRRLLLAVALLAVALLAVALLAVGALAASNEPITPSVQTQCRLNATHAFARYEYTNANVFAITLPIGAKNYMVPGPLNQGQPTLLLAGGPHTASEGDDEFVFGLNLDLSAAWHLTPHLAIVGGYDLLFLDNVQRAEDGMDFSNSNSGAVQATQNPDQLVIHSLFLGITFSF